MKKGIIFNVCLPLFALLTFIAGCAKAPVTMEQPKPVQQPAQQLPVKRGSLVIMSEPIGANVKVDDNPTGTTPLVLKDVPAGSYKIEVELTHYETFRSEVDVKHQQMAEVRPKLEPKPGALEIKSQPDGAKVQINGKDEGVTPYSKWVPSNVVHSIIISAEGYYPETQKIAIQPEGKEVVSIALKKIPIGVLEIKSEPTGASIWIDGKNVGVTTYKATLTADSEHEVILSAKGYDLKSQKVTVKPEEKQSISIALDKVTDKPGSIIREKDVAVMMLIPAGEFLMGSPDGEGNKEEHPQHVVFLDAFYIDRYEITNAQYKQFMDATRHKAPGYLNDPNYNAPNQSVVGVTWNDAKAYADWVGAQLPTEAEWEKAARGGLVGKKYPWGDSITHDDANYWEIGGKDLWSSTSPVGSFAPNGYGLYDMAGNVWEWCSDWYADNYYANSPKSNPTGPSSGSHRVLRGGSWHYSDDNLRVAYRYYLDPALTNLNVGFRCAVPK